MKYTQKRLCKNCMKGTTICVNNDILCREKGIVSPDYVCSNHRFQPEPKSFKEMDLKCIDCEHFILSVNTKDLKTYGVCHLFSVRKCDGSKKKACSKFVRRKEKELEVS